MGESFQCRGSGKGEGWGLLGMWPEIELVGKESGVLNVALFPLITTQETKSSFIINFKIHKLTV